MSLENIQMRLNLSMDTLAARAKAARKRAGLTQTEASEKSGVKQSDISKIERGDTLRSVGTLALAKAYGVSPHWLDSGDGPMIEAFDANVVAVAGGGRAYPVISYVQAGELVELSNPYSPGDGFDVEYGDDDASEWAVFLEIKGESMLPEFRPGDRVRIDPEVTPRPGDYVVAKNSDREATFKKYRVRGIDGSGHEVFELVPLNPDYPILRSDEHSLRVIGTMTEHRKKYHRR